MMYNEVMHKKGFSKVVIIIIAVLVVIVGLYFISRSSLVNNKLADLGVEKLRDANSHIDEIPTKRTLAPIETSESTSFSYSGVTFKVPWTASVSSTRELIGGVILTFKNDKGIVLMSVGGSDDFTYDEMNESFNTVPAHMPDVVKDEVEAKRIFGLLAKKAVLAQPFPVYSFETQNLKGFQLGDAFPVTRGSITPSVNLELFSPSGDNFSMIFVGEIPQPEIDFTLSSLKVK